MIEEKDIEEFETEVMDEEDRFFDSSVEMEYGISDIEVSYEDYHVFETYIKRVTTLGKEFTHDERMCKVQLRTYHWNHQDYLVVVFDGAYAYIAVASKELLLHLIKQYQEVIV